MNPRSLVAVLAVASALAATSSARAQQGDEHAAPVEAATDGDTSRSDDASPGTVRLRFRSDTPGARVHERTTAGTWSSLCDAPCERRFTLGEHRLGLSIGAGAVVPVRGASPVRLGGDDLDVSLSYRTPHAEDAIPFLAGGGVLAALGGAGLVALALVGTSADTLLAMILVGALAATGAVLGLVLVAFGIATLVEGPSASALYGR